MTSGVYAIVCQNGHRYIGSAVDVGRRQSCHRYGLRQGNHSNPHLQAAWAKYGESAFRFTVLEECEPDGLIAAEQSWMDTLQPEYNIARVAGSCLGIRCTEEKRAKMSAAAMGHVGWMNGKRHSLEARAKMSAAAMGHVGWMNGKKHSPETCAKISAANMGRVSWTKGKKITEETRAKISAAKKGRPNGLLGKKRPNHSATMMGHEVSQETRDKIAASNKNAKHIRWHVNRGIVNPKCELCKAANP